METPGIARLAQRLHDAMAKWEDVDFVEVMNDLYSETVYVRIDNLDGSFGEFFVSVEDA